MILLADGGSTKTHWCLVKEGADDTYFYSEGFNPYFVDQDYIVHSLKKFLPKDFEPAEIHEIHFYGAGIHDKERIEILENAFATLFVKARISIEHDLLGACRALLGTNKGFAAILGTGSNTCFYDGYTITHHIDSGAYILGDEGSGCHIGKKLLIQYLRGKLSFQLKGLFDSTHQLSREDIMNGIYTKPLASRFCAGFCEFISQHMNDPQIYQIIESSFDEFFENLVSLYPDYREYQLNAVGSIAFHFRQILKKCAQKHGMVLGKIIKSPIKELVLYHKTTPVATI